MIHEKRNSTASAFLCFSFHFISFFVRLIFFSSVCNQVESEMPRHEKGRNIELKFSPIFESRISNEVNFNGTKNHYRLGRSDSNGYFGIKSIDCECDREHRRYK